MADLDTNETNEVTVADELGINKLKVNSDGSAAVKGKNKVSTNNSSASTLGISGVFTGTGEDVTDVGMITINVFANQASAADGLSIQFSSDNTNWDHTDEFTVPINTGKTYTVQRVAKFFRIVYTNGVIAQTAFRLQVIFSPFAHKGSTHRISDSLTTEDDAELVKAVLAGEDTDTGDFDNVKVTNGRLLVSQEIIAPAGTTIVDELVFSSVATTSGSDSLYTITNGTTLTIQFLQATSEDATGGSVIELFEDPNGDLSVLNRLGLPIIVNGSFIGAVIAEQFTGDGTRRIVMRRRGFTASARDVGSRWIGFEE